MGRTTVVWEDAPEADTPPLVTVDEVGWRAFLGSWKWGAILAVACVIGLFGIFSTHPFASPSVSERVSDQLGKPASCIEVGAAMVANTTSSIYRCTVGWGTDLRVRCFSIADGDVRQLASSRKGGC
jgi:hypothetical protein